MLLIRKISVEEESGEKLETEKCNSLHWQISSDQMKGFKDEDNYKNYNNYNINYNNYNNYNINYNMMGNYNYNYNMMRMMMGGGLLCIGCLLAEKSL